MTSNHSTFTSSADSFTKPATMQILTGVPIVRHDNMMDLESLCASELHNLKKSDPFMYYSIPGATNPRVSEQDLDAMLPSLVMGSSMGSSMPNLMSDTEETQPRHAPRNRRRSVSDSHLFVERRSRISYESHFDVVMESIIGEMGELQARYTNCKRRRSSSFSDIEEAMQQVDRSPVDQDQVPQEKLECPQPRRGSVLQDILYSMFESMWDEDGDEKESD
eukprot:CCRYP_011811-RA/>CCRYP_011811-RA protein AED:0.31 eAED:0.31 QI:0/-1/0/1/-1/1/1/0/219